MPLHGCRVALALLWSACCSLYYSSGTCKPQRVFALAWLQGGASGSVVCKLQIIYTTVQAPASCSVSLPLHGCRVALAVLWSASCRLYYSSDACKLQCVFALAWLQGGASSSVVCKLQIILQFHRLHAAACHRVLLAGSSRCGRLFLKVLCLACCMVG